MAKFKIDDKVTVLDGNWIGTIIKDGGKRNLETSNLGEAKYLQLWVVKHLDTGKEITFSEEVLGEIE